MQLIVEENFPYGLSIYKKEQIEEIGLKMIDSSIQASDIEYDTEAMSTFFSDIEINCKKHHVWALFGSNDKTNWIPLQAASCTAGDVVNEIKKDFLCMTSIEARDTKTWNSYFFKSVMNIDYGLDSKCQKYREIKKLCKYFSIAVLVNESELEGCSDNLVTKYQKAECNIALTVKPLLWKPFGKEYTYLNSMPNSSSQ